MDYEQLYDAIFHRKSVRKYDSAPLPEPVIAELKAYCGTITTLVPEIETELQVLSPEQIKVNAPHAICLFSEKKDGWRMNAGFIMEQIDLYLSANHIGACWQGTAKPEKGKVSAPAGMEWVATICFGTPAQPMHRDDTSQFKRNTLNDISDISDLYHVLEAARLAPSAMNSQPWYFGGNAEKVTVSRKKSLLLDKLNQIDIGIALCCLWLALHHQGKRASFDFTPAPVPKGRVFMANVLVSEA